MLFKDHSGGHLQELYGFSSIFLFPLFFFSSVVPLPFSLDEFRIGHDFMVIRSTLDEIDAEGPSGMNCELLLSQETSDRRLGKGRLTKRRFHFGSRLPSVVQTMLGGQKALVVEEEAFTFYPYVEASYKCPLFGERYSVISFACVYLYLKIFNDHSNVVL